MRGLRAATAAAAELKLRVVPPARVRWTFYCFWALLLLDCIGIMNYFDFVGVWEVLVAGFANSGLPRSEEQTDRAAYSLLVSEA